MTILFTKALTKMEHFPSYRATFLLHALGVAIEVGDLIDDGNATSPVADILILPTSICIELENGSILTKGF